MLIMNRPQYKTLPFPKFRRFIVDAAHLAKENHTIYGFIELDVTEARQKIKTYKRETGKSVSLTSFIIACIGRAVEENPQMHAYVDRRERLVLFDDVDLLLPVEIDIDGHKFPVANILRAVNRKSPWEIEEDIRRVQAEGVENAQVRDNWKKLQYYVSLPRWIRLKLARWFLRKPHNQKAFLGTVAVTAVGMFGSGGGWGFGLSNHTLEIIIGGVARKLRQVGNKLQDRELLGMTISVNHDVIDGAPAARFTKMLRKFIESGEGLNP